jgi:nucleotide-binding universal stress UspA family protein
MATGADPYMNGGGISPDVIDFMEEDIKAYLERTADHLRQQGVTVSTAYSMLPPDEELSTIARGKPGALVVMTTHGRAGIGRAFLGSVTDRLLVVRDCGRIVGQGVANRT